ncbi:hypothetical protein THAOC_27377, partial [Thalassiosira oceanica]
PARPLRRECDAGPGQQRPKKRGRGRPRKGEGTERSRSRSETRRASQRIAQREAMKTDPVENHFENCRSGVGESTQALATAQWGAGDAKAGLAED